MSNYRQISVMAIILAIFAQAYASETENQSAVSAEQAVVAESAAVAELGNNVPETAVAAPKASVKKKSMDHFSVEFSDDVELAGSMKYSTGASDDTADTDDGMITISTSRYSNRNSVENDAIEIARAGTATVTIEHEEETVQTVAAEVNNAVSEKAPETTVPAEEKPAEQSVKA